MLSKSLALLSLTIDFSGVRIEHIFFLMFMLRSRHFISRRGPILTVLSFPITLQILSLEQNDHAFRKVTVSFKISESKEPGLMDKRFVVFVWDSKDCVSNSLLPIPLL